MNAASDPEGNAGARRRHDGDAGSVRAADPRRFERARRGLLAAWVVLLLLLASSFASSHFHLGIGNLLAGLGIAALKTAIVAWVFMALRESPALLRVTAAVGVALLAVLASLGAIDFGPRQHAPAAWQAPRQIAPALAQPHAQPHADAAPRREPGAR